ncbi:MAG: ATP-binding protein [Planctomycetaceae bacterium]|nr:ATP-binding protein [Planctomycetaceae bacterium]
MSSLFVILGSGQGVRHELLKRIVTIGRDSSNVLQLNDSEVSRRHAEVRRLDDVDLVVDLGSSNGVFVNSRRVTEQRLENGDQIQIGKTLFLYTKTSNHRLRRTQRPVAAIDFQPDTAGESARILHSVKPEEGSRLFNPMVEPPEFSWLAKAKSHLQVMYHTTLVVSQTLDIDRLLSRILELIFEWVRVDRGCILLFDAEGERLVPRVTRTRNESPEDERMTISRRILDYVLANREGVLTSDAQKDERWEPDGSIVRMGIREAICVPMQGRYSIVGVISIDTTTTPQEALSLKPDETRYLTTDHLKLMIAIAHQAALAVEDTRYYRGMVQAERLAAVGQTVAVLSHHIKNILQGIRGGSYLIEKGLADANNEMVASGWRVVDKNQNRISDLVLDMLTFSKEREPNLATDDVNAVVADVVELMHGRASDLGVKLEWLPGEGIPSFLFDAEQIHRAVTNIVTNAIDAARTHPANDDPTADVTLREGRVVIRTEIGLQALDSGLQVAGHGRESGEKQFPASNSEVRSPEPETRQVVRMIVDDNGPGIPPEMCDSLFRPFLSNKKGSGGTGLGLAVTHKIFEEHGGRIDIGTSPGGGARFVLELPLKNDECRMQNEE